MTDLRTASQMALDALRSLIPDPADANNDGHDARDVRDWRGAIEALRTALAQGDTETEQLSELVQILDKKLAQGEQEIVERGPWRAAFDKDAPKTVFVESDDFTHDVRLYVDGDFADEWQRLQYAQQIARMLNAFKLPTGEQAWQGLTDLEIDEICETQVWDARRSYARAIEAKLKAKNA